MQHTVEQLIERISVMKDKALLLHNIRNQYVESSDENYDYITCKALLEDIQSIALSIAKDKEGKDIRVENNNLK